MISNLQKAYVIHSRPYKETSLIVTFITEKKGKISAVAKGAKRKNSRLSGNLEPFQCLNIDYRGKSDLKSLVLAEPNEAYEDFFGSENLYSAFYVNELINYLVAQADESMEIFDIYKKCISNLKRNNQIEKIIILEPRDDELKKLDWAQRQIAFIIELRDALAPQVQAIIQYLGDLIVLILTKVVGRSIGLIGRGIAQGMGRNLSKG